MPPTSTPKPVICMQQHAIMPNSYTRFSGKSPQHLCQSRTSPAKTEPKFSETWNVAACFLHVQQETGNKFFTTGKSKTKLLEKIWVVIVYDYVATTWNLWCVFVLFDCVFIMISFNISTLRILAHSVFQYESLLLSQVYFTFKTKSCGHIDVNEMSVQCLKTTWPRNANQNVDQTASVEDYKAYRHHPDSDQNH